MAFAGDHSGGLPGTFQVALGQPTTNASPQSLGWEHYEVHEPEPHILLFK